MRIKSALLCLCSAALLICCPAVAAQTRFPSFPTDLKMSAGARVGNQLFVGLGTAGRAWYRLDLARPSMQWEARAEFPDLPRDGATAVALGQCIYVFAGQGRQHPQDTNLVMFDTVYQYDTVADSWKKLMTRTPQGLLASSAVSLDGRNILFFGGVNKQIFDGYFTDYFITAKDDLALQERVAQQYFSQRPQDYLFTRQILSYNPLSNQWRNLATDPFQVTVGSALAVHGNKLTLVGGEIKPGLRSPGVKNLRVAGEKLIWERPEQLPAPAAGLAQDGIAGGYAGYSSGVLLAAGGANFPGSWKQFGAGQLYAHKGLSKTWQDAIYARIGGRWRLAGRLPAGIGYSSYFQLDEGVLVVGGELQGGQATREVFLLKWNGKTVDVLH